MFKNSAFDLDTIHQDDAGTGIGVNIILVIRINVDGIPWLNLFFQRNALLFKGINILRLSSYTDSHAHPVAEQNVTGCWTREVVHKIPEDPPEYRPLNRCTGNGYP